MMASAPVRWLQRLVQVLPAFLLVWTSGAASQNALPAVVIMLHERPPYYTLADGQPAGIVVRPVVQALADSGLPHIWSDVPPPRQLNILRRTDTAACGVGWFRTPERETFARFSRLLYTDQPMVVLVRADDRRIGGFGDLASLIADPSLTFGTKTGYAYGTIIDELLERERPATVPSDRDSAGMAALLIYGQFDYMLLAREELNTVRAALRTDFGKLRVLQFPDMPLGNARYLMCNAAVPEAWIDRFDRALPMATVETD